MKQILSPMHRIIETTWIKIARKIPKLENLAKRTLGSSRCMWSSPNTWSVINSHRSGYAIQRVRTPSECVRIKGKVHVHINVRRLWNIYCDGHLTSDSITACLIYCLFIFVYYSVSFQFIVSLHMLTHYMHVHFPFILHTHWVAFLMTLNLHVKILDVLFLWSGVRRDRMLYEDSEFLPIWIWYSYLLFIHVSAVSWFYITTIHYPVPYSYIIMCGCYMWHCSDIDLS